MKIEPSALPEWVEVGRVRRPHGVRGELLIESSSDVGGRFAAGSELQLVPKRGARRRVRVDAARSHGDGVLVRLEGFESRDDVEPLRGAHFEVERSQIPEAPEGSYYYFELIGCVCSDRHEGELGVVEGVLEDGGGLLLEVRGEGRSVPVPFVDSFLRSIDVEGRCIELELPAGLLETCAST
jgi:16S rRNA processing protein RimM